MNTTTSADPVPDIEILPNGSQDKSEKRLNELGYAQTFKREMSFWAVVGISFTAIGILTGMSSAFQTGLFSGGPLGLFWGWVNTITIVCRSRVHDVSDAFYYTSVIAKNICSIFMFLIALSLAEICSAWPTAGGLYYWVNRMKPDIPWLGFYTGHVYAWAMVLTGTSGNLSVALYIASAIQVSLGTEFTRVQIAAIAWGINILSGIINTVGAKAIGGISAVNVWWTLGGTLVLAITLLVKAPVKNSANFVFLDFENFTGWSNQGFVVLLGFLQAVYTLEGCETAAQVAEEAHNAEWLAPIALTSSVAGSWFIGLIYMICLLFSVQSIESVQQTSFAIPISQLFYDAAGQRLAILCIVVVLVAQWAAAMTAFTASSRLFYALARDNALPFKSVFIDLNRTRVPYAGVWLSVFVGCIISAAYIGSAVAFNGILSAAAISVMISYAMPMMCRVFWPESLSEKGPFHLGRWSWPINAVCVAFVAFITVLFVMPTSMPVTGTTMNYAIVAIGGILILVSILYFSWGRYHFKGIVPTLATAGTGMTADVQDDKKFGEDEKGL